jgi:hypothetical protein
MARTLNCPECGLPLKQAADHDLLECEGCGSRFDPSSLRYEQAPEWRQLAGLALIGLGVLFFLTAIDASLPFISVRETDAGMKLLGAVMLPTAAILGGLALVRGRVVLDRVPDQSVLLEGEVQHEDGGTSSHPGADETR